MFMTRPALLAGFAAIVIAFSTQPGDNLDAYLTKDGKLTNPLEIRDLQGGFAGFTGNFYKVGVDGKWSTGKVFQQKMTEEKSGTLGKDDIAKLAKALAKYDLEGLKSEGKQGTNPHVVTIKFGKVEATLSLGTGEPLPKVDGKMKTAGQRYAGVVEAVTEAIGKKEK
ncbi:MAG TPA: hypothetical protein VE988_29795 [Gemmataceae bacterium]|nr:hypothetical protein [Gemmataceae bacterium]